MIFLLCIIGIALSSIHINKHGNFVDENGSIRIFHGFNVVYKPAPYFPIIDHFDVMTSFSDEDCQLLVSLGFNVIRLHVAFEAGMPQRGQLNEEYLLHIRDIVRLAAKYDIYVILDAHQDLLNRQFCGEGFPDWAITKTDFPAPQTIELRLDEQGYPLIEDCLKQDNFAKFYLTSDVGKNLESILKNENGVADMFGLFWKRVAELHKDEQNVLGYEIMNEPASGNFQRNKIQYVWPGWANKHLIMPFYQIINKYIRQVDTEKLVFFEPYFTDVLGVGFRHNVGGRKYKKKEVLSYHLYCGIESVSKFLCKQLYNFMYPLKKLNINHLGTGSMLTEFGALPNEPFAKDILNSLLYKADKYLQSWAYWQYKGYNDFTTASNMFDEGIFNQDGSLQNYKIEALVRPYAQQICASKVFYSKFNSKKQEYSLKYDSIKKCETVIFVPDMNAFKSGFEYICKLKKGYCDLQQQIQSVKCFRSGQIGHIGIDQQQMIIIFNYLISIVLCEFRNGYYIDKNETIKIFHGVNLNDYPLTKISENDFIELSKVGYNLIRVSIYFDQLIPDKPTSQQNLTYNSTYLINLEQIVQLAKKHKFYVIFVADQLLLNKQFCGYGFPDWAIQRQNFPFPYDNNGKIKFDLYPSKDQCKTNYDSFIKTDDVGNNFENLYKNVNNITEYFGLFWQKIAEKMKNEENVIGYDLLNNPQCGNYYKTYYQCIWPGWNNRQLIMPFYQKINAYIREVEKQKIVFYQTQDTDFIGSGFDDNINKEYKQRESYSYKITYKQEYFKELTTNWNYYSMWFEYHIGKHAQVSTFLAEFSGTNQQLLSKLLNYADYFQSSWTYKGSIQQALKLDELHRPYAQSICAQQVLHHQYDSINQIFKLQYITKNECSTLIYIPFDFEISCSNCILKIQDKRIFELKMTILGSFKQVNLILWKKRV